MILGQNKKNNVYPCKPHNCLYKVWFSGVFITWTCLHKSSYCILKNEINKASKKYLIIYAQSVSKFLRRQIQVFPLTMSSTFNTDSLIYITFIFTCTSYCRTIIFSFFFFRYLNKFQHLAINILHYYCPRTNSVKNI